MHARTATGSTHGGERYALTVIAATGAEFADFGPYVASIDNGGRVAFQAALQSGGSGVFVGDGATVRAAGGETTYPAGDFFSHPDVNDAGEICVYRSHDGQQSVAITAGDGWRVLATTGESLARIGPLGPTMNARGQVAFRAETASGLAGVFVTEGGRVVTVADARRFEVFHGLPVVDGSGRVVFRGDERGRGAGIFAGRGGALEVLVDTTGPYAQLGSFPCASEGGTVAFAATLRGGGSGLYAVRDGAVRCLVEPGGAFESVRGGLINDVGAMVFFATPPGGRLGIYARPDPRHDGVLALGGALFGSTLEDFALNPVSLNAAGQIAVRARLADGRQFILRADPS